MTKVSFGASYVGDQVIARVMENRDGSAYVETWRKGAGWIKGGATFDEFIFARPVPPEMAKRQGFPMENET